MSASHRDFKVRRSNVLRALHWLIEHNTYYSDITIDHDVLSRLPNDGDISNLFVNVPLNQEEGPAQHHDDAYTDRLGSTFVPMVTRGRTELQTIHSILDPPSSQTISWPPAGVTPVNEFTTVGYISCAFPALFPTGAAEFLAPQHRSITIGNYFDKIVKYS